jgi:hypothetical protein
MSRVGRPFWRYCLRSQDTDTCARSLASLRETHVGCGARADVPDGVSTVTRSVPRAEGSLAGSEGRSGVAIAFDGNCTRRSLVAPGAGAAGRLR